MYVLKDRRGWSKPVDWTRSRPIRRRESCVLLDSDGRRCLTPATLRRIVHGNHEYDSNWYAVPMCADHDLTTP